MDVERVGWGVMVDADRLVGTNPPSHMVLSQTRVSRRFVRLLFSISSS